MTNVTDNDRPEIIEFTDLNIALIRDLIEESLSDGYLLVERTLDEWNRGLNKFSKLGRSCGV